MAGYVIKRLLFGAATLFVIAAVTFFLMHSIPGGPFSTERALPPQVEANLQRKYRLDEPTWKQFVSYIGGAIRGDLGPSFSHEARTVNSIIRDSFPRSAAVGLTAFIIAVALGVPAGIVSAARSSRFADRMLMVGSVLGVTVPSFILASLLQYLFSYRLRLAPAGGWGDSWWQLVLPAAALSVFPLAFISRLVRSSMLAILGSDYVRTARAKGLSGSTVLIRHALRNALLPLVTYSGPLLAALLTGSFVVENIFDVHGLGQFFVSSINDRDYTVIMGVTLFYSTLLVGLNVVADILYCLLDPRIDL